MSDQGGMWVGVIGPPEGLRTVPICVRDVLVLVLTSRPEYRHVWVDPGRRQLPHVEWPPGTQQTAAINRFVAPVKVVRGNSSCPVPSSIVISSIHLGTGLTSFSHLGRGGRFPIAGTPIACDRLTARPADIGQLRNALQPILAVITSGRGLAGCVDLINRRQRRGSAVADRVAACHGNPRLHDKTDSRLSRGRDRRWQCWRRPSDDQDKPPLQPSSHGFLSGCVLARNLSGCELCDDELRLPAGQLGPRQMSWPPDTTLALSLDKVTVVAFLHPRCVCTRTTVKQLIRTMQTYPGSRLIVVVFVPPRPESDAEWENAESTTDDPRQAFWGSGCPRPGRGRAHSLRRHHVRHHPRL